jgi:hypothetical protein
MRAERPGVERLAASDPAEPAPFELAFWTLVFADVAFAMDSPLRVVCVRVSAE